MLRHTSHPVYFFTATLAPISLHSHHFQNPPVFFTGTYTNMVISDRTKRVSKKSIKVLGALLIVFVIAFIIYSVYTDNFETDDVTERMTDEWNNEIFITLGVIAGAFIIAGVVIMKS